MCVCVYACVCVCVENEEEGSFVQHRTHFLVYSVSLFLCFFFGICVVVCVVCVRYYYYMGKMLVREC